MMFLKNYRLPNAAAIKQFVSQNVAMRSSSSSFTTPETANNVSGILSQESYGQPTACTHPHLINEGELTPGLSILEYQQRREGLMKNIQKYARDNAAATNSANHLVIIPSASKKYMSEKIPYVFRQNSDFLYLTGCLEPDSALMLHIDESSKINSALFMRPKDKQAELWDGPRTGVENSPEFFGVNEAYNVEQFELELQRRFNDKKPLIWYDSNQCEMKQITKYLRKITEPQPITHSPTTFIQGLRLFKSKAEQHLMLQTCQIASSAINDVMIEARPGVSEHHIFAMIDYKCRMRNASYLAYPPVVASGNNATTIHYINNSQLTKSGELVLMDAGCEYAGYTSDITRTWPISGEFTDPQKVLYEMILQLQKDLLAKLLKEGGETLDNLFDSMCLQLGKYLQEIGLVPKSLTSNTAIARAGYKFCPHHVSHYLGMDVHDTPLMPRSLQLQPGMVFTVEPGIYIAQDRNDVPKEFRGIGIRIEDDVQITTDGRIEILTASCIKDPTILQNLCKSR